MQILEAILRKKLVEFNKYGPKITRGFLVLLLAIIANEVVDNSILSAISGISHGKAQLGSVVTKASLLALFLGVQVICAPLQASISDFSCRKKSLLFSLCVSLFALVALLFFKNFILALVALSMLKGGAGNTLPIAWGGIVDEEASNKSIGSGEKDLYHVRRNSFAVSIVVIGWGYLFFKLIMDVGKGLSINYNILSFVLCLIFLFFCWIYYLDKRDKDKTKQLSLGEKLREERSEIHKSYYTAPH